MVALSETAVVPPEGWERARDRLRARIAATLARHPRYLPVLARARSWGLWGALILLAVMAIALPRYRQSLSVYAACFWILIVWFALTRTKTIGWSGLARMFSAAVVWSWVIAWVSYRLAGSVDLRIRDDGPGIAIASFTEESLKLLPVIAVALIAPGRVRRFAAVDWLLLGLAAGLGFQAWEDLLRRLAQSVLRPGLLDFLFDSSGPGSGSPQYSWGPLAGGSGKWSGGDVYGYAGHHVFTALVAAAVGLGIAAWRHSNRTSDDATTFGVPARWAWRSGALLLPALTWYLVIVAHFGYNAILNDSRWLESETSAPWVIRATWSHVGKGTGMGWLLLLFLLACLLVDAARLHAAGSATDLPAATVLPAATGLPAATDRPDSETSWIFRPRTLIERWALRSPADAARWRSLTVSFIALLVHTARDLTVIAAAHARDSESEPRRAAIVRGRAAATLLRQVRTEALTSSLLLPVSSQHPGEVEQARAFHADELDGVGSPEMVRAELQARRRVRLVAAGALGIVLVVGLVLAAQIARNIGTDLTPGNGLFGWLAGQFDSLGRWWAARSGAEKLLIGAGIAALIALSGGSLGFAFGVSGALTYTAEHARGAADFTRDPVGATRSWLDTTTPAELALELAEFGLTFAPGNFAGAAAGRGARSLAREFLDDPAAWLARRRAAMRGDRGAVELPGGGRRPNPPGARAADHPPRSWPDNPEPGTPEYDLGWDPAVQRFRAPEYRTAARVMDDYDVTLTRAAPGQPFDWVDEAGRSYDAVGGFPGRFLDRQWESFTGQIVKHLDKADLIPVDVSEFSPQQIAQVKEFIAPLGPRVFIVGG